MDSEHLEAYLSGELDSNGRRQVEDALRRDSDLRASFIHQMQMDSMLDVLLTPEASAASEEFEQGVIARLKSEGAGDYRNFAKSVLTEIVEEREGVRPIHWPDLIKAGFIAAAASVALMFLLQSIIFRDGANRAGYSFGETVAPASFVARIEDSTAVEWAPSTAGQIREDGWLTAGLLEINSGTVMIAFNSGATTVVEAPAKLSIETGNRVFLKTGSLTANVPPRASGFTVNTPRLNAVDIGTRFGISVAENGDSELHVMEGEVEASRTSGNAVAVLVKEGLALRADSRTRNELKAVPYGGDNFTMQIGQQRNPEPLLRYSFDESGGAVVEDTGSLKQFDVPLVGSGELGTSPRRAAGQSGGGLVFQPGDHLNAPLSKEFRLDEAHTVSFWVKVPPKLGRDSDEIFLHFGRETLDWQIACNFSQSNGAKGALRVGFTDGYVIGSTDIADGNWHHIAYRFIGGEDADISSHVHLFVDGYPERISDFTSADISKGRAGNLQLGSDDTATGLQGWLDEVSIYQDAIPTQVIQGLGN